MPTTDKDRASDGSGPGGFTRLDRRGFLAGAGCAALLAALRSPAAVAAMREQTALIRATAIAPGEPVQPLSFDLFFDLSRFVTARARLDEAFGRDLFAVFRQEEWGWANAARLYRLIHEALDAGLGSAPELLASGRLDHDHQWYGAHLVGAWYDGVYWRDGQLVRIGYRKALMWEPVRDIIPVQGLSDRPYGYWAEVPAGADER